MKNLEEMGNHMFEETKPRIVKSHDIKLDSDSVGISGNRDSYGSCNLR